MVSGGHTGGARVGALDVVACRCVGWAFLWPDTHQEALLKRQGVPLPQMSRMPSQLRASKAR